MSPDAQELMTVVAPLYARMHGRATRAEAELERFRDRVACLLDEACGRGQRAIDVVRLAHAIDRDPRARRAS